MNQYSLVNLSGRSIPPDSTITISGEPKPGDVLVIETYSQRTGSAVWRTEAEFKAQRDAPVATERPAWAPPLKPKMPYT
jgi:hypothetical protein